MLPVEKTLVSIQACLSHSLRTLAEGVGAHYPFSSPVLFGITLRLRSLSSQCQRTGVQEWCNCRCC